VADLGAYAGVATAFGLLAGLGYLAVVVILDALVPELRTSSRRTQLGFAGTLLLLALMLILTSEGVLPLDP
jgi:hypothetical protein